MLALVLFWVTLLTRSPLQTEEDTSTSGIGENYFNNNAPQSKELS
jgi:hypothetical protein